MMRIALIQLPAVGMNDETLEEYLSIAYHKHSSMVVMGEYVLSPFFKTLPSIPQEMLQAQSTHHIQRLSYWARRYNLHIVAPIIRVEAGHYWKNIAYITPKTTLYYTQNFLIPYSHWDEEHFFTPSNTNTPLVVTYNEWKIAIMGGFEAHFDPMWAPPVDIAIIPSASTFDSHQRWRELLKMRAFTHQCYVIRANRVGEYYDEHHRWHFYGDSLGISPEGEIEMSLGEQAGIGWMDLHRSTLTTAREGWGFLDRLDQRRNVL